MTAPAFSYSPPVTPGQTGYQNNANTPATASYLAGGQGGYNAYQGGLQAQQSAQTNAGLFGQLVNYNNGVAQLQGASNSNAAALANLNTGGMAADGTIGGLSRDQAVGLQTINGQQAQNSIGLDNQTLAYLAQTGQIQKTSNDQTVQILNNLLADYNNDRGLTNTQYDTQAGQLQNQSAQDVLSNTQAKSKERSDEIAGGGLGASGFNQDLGAYDQQAQLLGQKLQLGLQGNETQRGLAQSGINESINRFVNTPLSNQQAQYAQQQADNANSVNRTNTDISQQQLNALQSLTQASAVGKNYDNASSALAQRNALQQQQANMPKFFAALQSAQGKMLSAGL